MRSLDALMSLAKKKARREALIAIGKKIFDIDINLFMFLFKMKIFTILLLFTVMVRVIYKISI